MPEIVPLKAIDLRDAWPREDRDFTPWLAKNLDLLSSSLSLDLVLKGEEVNLPRGSGRVDVLAEQRGTEARVVIENQLEESDNSHCLRLLGYAANADADILIWVAKGFTDYHRSILAWLNKNDSIAVYAVAIKAYKVGETLTCNFDLVVEPQSRPLTPVTATRANANTRYADFYRPIRAQLSQAGLDPVGRGGWRGSWRSFQSGYSGIDYVTRLTGNEAWALLRIYGNKQEAIHEALTQQRGKIDARLGDGIEWLQGEEGAWAPIRLRETVVEDSLKNNPEVVQQWIVKNLISLRDGLQPFLDKVMEDLGMKKTDETD